MRVGYAEGVDLAEASPQSDPASIAAAAALAAQADVAVLVLGLASRGRNRPLPGGARFAPHDLEDEARHRGISLIAR